MTETWRQELRRLERVVNHLHKLSPASLNYLRSLLDSPNWNHPATQDTPNGWGKSFHE